jgi:beta-glucanase (GH16 family)
VADTRALLGRAVRLGAAVVLALAVTVLAPATPTSAAAPGWRLAFSTDFTGGSLPKGCGTYGGPYAGGATFWDEEHVQVAGGLLRIVIEKKSQGGMPYTAGGMGCWDHAQTYGKFEWRARVPVGKGIDSYATLWMARQGDDNNESLIEILGTPGAETMAVTNGYGSGKVGEHIAGRYADGFHTYTIEWLPDRFRVVVDGVAKFSSARVPKVPKWLGFAVSNGDNYAGLPDAATVLPAEFQVDWARVYAYVPNAPPTSSAPSATPPGSSAPTTSGSRPSVAAGPVDPVTGGPSGTRAWPWLAGGVLVVALAAGGLRLVWRRRHIDLG